MILEKKSDFKYKCKYCSIKEFFRVGPIPRDDIFSDPSSSQLSFSVIRIFMAKEEDKGTGEKPEGEQKDKDALD